MPTMNNRGRLFWGSAWRLEPRRGTWAPSSDGFQVSGRRRRERFRCTRSSPFHGGSATATLLAGTEASPSYAEIPSCPRTPNT